MRRVALLCLCLSACVVRPAATFDGGSPDASEPDSGDSDAGTTDSGTPDAGAPDAGLPCDEDAGSCGLPPHAPYCEIMKSPRQYPMVERLVLEATGEFVADDVSYQRAASGWELLEDASFGPRPLAVLPDLVHGVPGYWLTLDDAGIELLVDGGYHDWDCLNALYGATGKVLSIGSGPPTPADTWGIVEFDSRVLNVVELAADYRTLPHVVDVEPDSYGCTCDCGTNNDTCLDIDGGLFTLIGNLETGQCDELWFRVTVYSDGGRQLEERDSGVPLDWFRQAPACLHRLQALRSFDAGF